MRKGKLLVGVLSAAMVLGSLALPENISIGGNEVETSFLQSVEASTDDIIYADSITIYGMNSTYEDVLSIPSDYVQSYQIENEDAVSYSVYSGSSVTVSDEGLIEAAYKYGTNLVGGESVVEVMTDDESYYIFVNVEDYSDVYVDNVIEEFIDENITSDMTDMELMRAICSFPASYDYSASYVSAKNMILYGGGSCWASTDLIIKTCEKLGILAWSRNGNKDAGAGSGHVNAMVEYNDSYYMLEAGYSGTAPRSYTVTERYTLFSLNTYTGGREVYQYDGYVTGYYELEIPEVIGGLTVVSIGDGFAMSDRYLSKITIPDTIVNIGDYAFYYCTALTDFNIPASVTSIGVGAFAGCSSLTDFTCDDNNEYYTIVDGILYDKDMTTVCGAPCVTEVELPSTVENISDYAFYYSGVTAIEIPVSVESIGDDAFTGCRELTDVYYLGSEEEWDEISIGSNNAYLTSATIHFNSSMPACAINSVTIDNESLIIDETAQITASGIGTITYSSSDTSIVTVDSTGLVTAIGAGTTSIIVTATRESYGVSTYETLTVTVGKKSQTIIASAESSSISVGATTQITASGNGTITYSSSDTNIATVNSSGLVTGVTGGVVIITVNAAGDETYAAASKTITIEVNKLGQTVIASYKNNLSVGETNQIVVTAVGDITYTSSDEDVIEVSDSGLVTAINCGSASVEINIAGDEIYASNYMKINITVSETYQAGTDTSTDEETGTSTDVELDTSTETETDTSSEIDTNSGTSTSLGTEEEITYLLGDVNNDGEITYLDAMMVLRYDAALITLTDEKMTVGDVNKDGDVNSLDAIKILRYDAGLITSF